jgi:alkylation response protein AidB-like acyl-CoA dehydrogenase
MLEVVMEFVLSEQQLKWRKIAGAFAYNEVRPCKVFGGYGILRENHIEKLVRDATAMLHAFVGNHAMRENLAGILLKEVLTLI